MSACINICDACASVRWLVNSSSTLRICLPDARNRVFCVVGLSEVTIGKKPSWGTSDRAFINDFPAASSPIQPIRDMRPPSPAKLRATFAAPPGITCSFVRDRTGIGASGDIRSTDPDTNLSSITSPIIRIWRFWKSARTAATCSAIIIITVLHPLYFYFLLCLTLTKPFCCVLLMGLLSTANGKSVSSN